MNERLIKQADCEGMWLFIHNHFLGKKKYNKLEQVEREIKTNTASMFSVFTLMLKTTDDKALLENIFSLSGKIENKFVK